jgi:hypothetical protein
MAFDDDDRRGWIPLIAVGVVIVGLAIGLLVVSRRDDEASQVTGTLPDSFPSVATASSTPPTTPPPTTAPATAPVVTVAPATTEPDGGATTSPGATTDPDAALAELDSQMNASEVSGAVRIGSGLYAMLIVTGTGRLVRWGGTQWEDAATVDPPGVIDSVQTADVTDDGVPEFILGLAGLDQLGGVYGQQGFSFDFLPFNTTTGPADLVAGLQYRFGQLESPFRDASGTRTLIWTWTGRMFETQ